MRHWPALSLIIMSLLATTGCATNPATGKKQISLIGEAREVQIGKESDQQIVNQYGLYGDQQLASYISRIGLDLAAESERPELPWTFRVLDDPVVNAFALPGGYIYITRGILGYLGSEAEIAAVLGHEIGHVTARHGVNRMSKAQLANIGLGVGMIAAPELAQSFGGLAQAGVQLLFLKYSRDDERQADELGFRYATIENYPGSAFAEVFRTLGASGELAGGTRLPGYLATHPDPLARAGDAERRAAEQPPEAANASWRRPDYLRNIDGLTFGADPRQGFFRGDTFHHPELGLSWRLPTGWKAHNLRQAVVAVSPEQDAMVQLTLTGEQSAEAAAQKFYNQQGLRVGDQFRPGGRGQSLQASRRFVAGAEPNELYGSAGFIEHSGRVFQLVGMAKPDSWQARGTSIDSALGGFGKLSERRFSNVDPMRIDLVKLDRAMTIEEFHRRYPSDIEVAELAVINHVRQGETMDRGRQVKRVRGFNPGPQTNVTLGN